MGINWSFDENKCTLGILQFNLGAPNVCECKWKLENEKIKRSRDSYRGDLALRFEEALSLIPENVFITLFPRLYPSDEISEKQDDIKGKYILFISGRGTIQ